MNKQLLHVFSVVILSVGLISLLMIFWSPIGSAEFYISIITFIIDIAAFITCIIIIKKKFGG